MRTITWALIALMAIQSALGILLSGRYRDVEWITAAWFANDWITLLVAVPLLCFSHVRVRRGDVRQMLILIGLVGYAVYNYAFYLFGAKLNVFFPLYVLGFVGGVVTLLVTCARLDIDDVARALRPHTPERLAGGYLVFVAAGLTSVWLGMWGAYAFAGRPTPIEPEAFKVVAALDLTLMVPALAIGGVLLWQREPWGYVVAPLAAIQAAMYLLVLSVASLVAVHRGLAKAPGELAIWGPLAICTLSIALALLWNANGRLARS